MNDTLNICSVKSNELHELGQVFRNCFEESGYPGTFSFFAYARLWVPLLERNSGVMLASLDEKGEVQGVVAITFLPDPLNNEMTATLMLWYVRPDLRGTGLGRELLDIVEKMAVERKCKAIVHGHRLAVNKDGGKRLLEPRGYTLEEFGFRKAL